MDRQRLDKWLWHARMVRTRADAAGLVTGGRVRVNSRRIDAPGHALKRGDVVTVALDGRICVWRIDDFAERRGDSGLARTLYTDIGKG